MTNTMGTERAILLACWPGRDPLLRGLGIDAALVEVAGKPLVQRVVERAVALGVKRVDVLLGDDPEPYRACLGNGERWGCIIAYHYAPSDSAIPRALARQLAVIERCLLLTADAMPPREMPPASSYGCIDPDPGLRAAWACASGTVIARVLVSAGSAEALAAALRNDAQMSRADVAPTTSAGSAAALLDVSRQLLDVPDYPIGIAWRPHAEGLWIGNGARIHPEARLVPPVYVGDHVLVAAGARIGPNAVVGARAIVDGSALVVDSLVLPSTYVGRGVELRRSIAAGRRLVNVDLGVEMDIRDRELLGAAAGEAASGPTLAERGLAALLWFVTWPLARLASGPDRGTPRSGEPEPLAAIDHGVPGAWVRHFVRRMHPGLRDVARGQRRIVGPLAGPCTDPIAPPAACGLINDRLYLGPDGAEPALADAADRLGAQPQSLVRILSAVLRYATAVAVDWRSLRVPPTESAPRLARDS